MKTRMMAMVVLALAGCSRGEQPADAAGKQGAAPAPTAVADEAVAAVLQSTGKPAARLAFLLNAKPVLGAASTLRLDLTAAEAVTALLLTVEGDGVAIDPATSQASLAFTSGATVVSHQVTFTPQRAGLAQITVRLRGEAAESPETVYVIPLLATGAPAG